MTRRQAWCRARLSWLYLLRLARRPALAVSSRQDAGEAPRSACARLRQEPGVRPGARQARRSPAWVNILPDGGFHAAHIHPLSVISGTFYVATPEGSSALKFEDPQARPDDGGAAQASQGRAGPAPGLRLRGAGAPARSCCGRAGCGTRCRSTQSDEERHQHQLQLSLARRADRLSAGRRPRRGGRGDRPGPRRRGRRWP